MHFVPRRNAEAPFVANLYVRMTDHSLYYVNYNNNLDEACE